MPLNDYIPHPLNISVGKVVKVLDGAGAAPPAKADVTPHADEKPVPGTTAAAPGESGVQKLDKGLNWVPVEKRAKGGPVKAGGAPMKNVDNSGMTKEKC